MTKMFIIMTGLFNCEIKDEGSRLSDEDVEKLLRGIDIQRFADREVEVKGYFA